MGSTQKHILAAKSDNISVLRKGAPNFGWFFTFRSQKHAIFDFAEIFDIESKHWYFVNSSVEMKKSPLFLIQIT